MQFPYQRHMPAVITQNPMTMGTVIETDTPFALTWQQLAVHMAVLGGSGSGKSKFLELKMRHFLANGLGFCLVDPHGDLAEDVLAFAAAHKAAGNDELWRRIHYIEPSYEATFGYDPFCFQPREPIPPSFEDNARRAWLHTKVDRIIEILQRKQGQIGVEGFPRLQRVLTDVLTAVGTAVDEHDRHLPFADSLVLLDVFHGRHDAVYRVVEPHLHTDIRADFEVLHRMRSQPQQLLTQTESTINRLRSFLSPLVRAIFCDSVNTINFTSIHQNGDVLLVNLRETDYFSADQAKAIGGLFIHEILATAQSAPRQLRRPYALVVEEAAELIGADVQRALGATRKYLLSLVIVGQDLSSFRKGPDFDMGPKLLSQCGTIVCFQQSLPQDLDVLVPALCYGNLNFDELYEVKDRPDGHEFLDIDEYCENFTWQDTYSNACSLSHNHSDSLTGTRQNTLQQSHMRGTSHQSAHGVGRQNAVTEGDAHGTNQGEVIRTSRDHFGEQPEKRIPTYGRNAQHSRAVQSGTNQFHTETDGVSEQEGTSASQALGHSAGVTNGRQRGITATQGGSLGGGLTVSHKKVLIPRHREEWHPTGRLRKNVEDQFHYFKQRLHSLGVAQALVRLRGCAEAFFIRVDQVVEWWATMEDKYIAIARLKERLRQFHPYYHVPDLSPEGQEQRLNDFLQSPVIPHVNGRAIPSINGVPPPHKNGQRKKQSADPLL